jgi:predicted nucleic acid-binding protein
VVSGAVGVLISAKRNGWIPELKPELLALRAKARFFLSAKIFAEALAGVGETV